MMAVKIPPVWSSVYDFSMQKVNTYEIHNEFYEIYVPIVVSEGSVEHWCEFNEGHTYSHDKERSEKSPVQIDDFVEQVIAKIWENQYFTISILIMEFSDISQSTVVHDIVTEKLCYSKLLQDGFQKYWLLHTKI